MGFGDALRAFFGGRGALDGAFFDDLADALVEGDFPAADAFAAAEDLRALCRKEKITTPSAARSRFATVLREGLDAAYNEAAWPSPAAGFNVILLLGVNGVGKTTTAAKLAALFANEAKPLLAAADTFRAAAIDQLKIHGERLGVRVVAGMPGGDSAACVFDAVSAAKAGAYNPVIADTAGRMHTKSALVEELKKIDRIIYKALGEGQVQAAGTPEAGTPAAAKMPEAKKYLVLDATTGSNALVQAETFCEAVRLDGAILTKCDSQAKGGVVFPLASRLHLPVLYTCHGERYADIRRFDAAAYTRSFLGIEEEAT